MSQLIPRSKFQRSLLMKILFVSSGNSKNFKIAPFIYQQGESLKKSGIKLEYYAIKGKGLFGYLKNILPLRRRIKKGNYDIVHTHYCLSGWVKILTLTKTKHILSLMGDDAYGTYNSLGKRTPSSYYLIILTKMIQPFVDYIIAKSKGIEKAVYLKGRVTIVPNGVDLNRFTPLEKELAREGLGLDKNNDIILFLGDRVDSRKNYALARKSCRIIGKNDNLFTPYPVEHGKVSVYLNATDVLLFTSTAEGSSNLIKEAMACNCPIVSTDVGDVRLVIGDTEGCYITSFDPKDVAEKLQLALKFAKEKRRTNGRERIIKLGLDSESVDKRIIDIYKKVLK